MVNAVPLDNVTHAKLRVVDRYGAEFGDNLNQVPTFPTEFGDIQRSYPILFRQDPNSGEHQSVAILGLDPGENLFLENGHWNAAYIPAALARGPFLIGFEQHRQTPGQQQAVIHVDLNSPRVSETEGHVVFMPHGGQSPYLERIGLILEALYQGVEMSKQMFRSFQALDLLEPVKLEANLSDTEQYRFHNYLTISQEKLAALDGDSLESLNRAGFLQGAFLVLASLNNMHQLVDLKRSRQRALAV